VPQQLSLAENLKQVFGAARAQAVADGNNILGILKYILQWCGVTA